MNDRYLWRALGVAALVIVVAAAVGMGAYNAGVAQGIAESGRTVAPPAGAPAVYMWPRPWGFGFFPFFPIFPILFFFFFLFFVLRGLLWRGPWRGGCGYYRYGHVPPDFEEWHRRAHGEQPPSHAPGGAS